MEEKKMNFFKRINIATVKIEDYNKFLNEKTSVAVKYFFLIVFVLVVLLSIAETYDVNKKVQKLFNYIETGLSDFSFQDNTLKFENDYTYAYDRETDTYLIADTVDEISQEKVQEYLNQIKSKGLLFLKDRAIYKADGETTETYYSDASDQMNIESLTRAELIQKIEGLDSGGTALGIVIFLGAYLYIVQIVSIFIDWMIITLFAIVSSRILRVKMTKKQCLNISIYALTLPIILSCIYNIVYYFTGFYIEYFRTIYLMISYVYVVAAILIMRSDGVKQQVEIGKIEKVQKEVHDEYEEQENNDEEDKQENDDKINEKDDNKSEDEIDSEIEPDGSEI